MIPFAEVFLRMLGSFSEADEIYVGLDETFPCSRASFTLKCERRAGLVQPRIHWYCSVPLRMHARLRSAGSSQLETIKGSVFRCAYCRGGANPPSPPKDKLAPVRADLTMGRRTMQFRVCACSLPQTRKTQKWIIGRKSHRQPGRSTRPVR